MNALKKAEKGLCLCLATFSLSAGATAGTAVSCRNLLNNPSFDCSTDTLPDDWNLSYEFVRPYLSVGEDGQGRYMEFHPSSGEVVLKQDDMHLVPGAEYRVGAWVRSKALTVQRSGIVITSWAWAEDRGPSIPLETHGEWMRVEKTIKAPASHNETYNMVIYTVGMAAGELAVRNPFVEPIDERAADGVLRAPRPSELNVITPVSPLLQKIPAGDSSLMLVCRARKAKTTCAVSVRFEGEEDERLQGEYALSGERIFARLKSMPENRLGELRLCLKSEGRVVAETKYEIHTLPAVSLSHPPERGLNGLVTRLLTASSKPGEYSFSMPEDGWAYISLERGDEQTTGCFDGDPTPVLRWREGEHFETMRRLKKGDHILRLSGKPEGRLLINKIPELFCDSYPAPNLKSYAFVTDEFRRRYIYSAFNVYCYGWSMNNVSKDEWEDFKERGKSLMCQDVHWRPYIAGWTNRYETAEALAARLRRNSEGMSPFYDGTCFDEVDIFCTREKWIYAQATRKLADLVRPFYTWSSRVRFSDCPLNAEYLSACLNASRGNGKFLFECYPHYSAKSETALRDYLDEYLDDTIRRGKVLSPCINPNAMIVMGMYSDMCGSISYDDAGRYDPKRLIDLYVRSLVTRRDFRGLGGFGIYAYNNANEEDVRWVSHVVRHYLIDGNSECLTDKLGIGWNPGIIFNGDFSMGLSGWTVESTGSIAVYADSLDGFGKGVLKRDRAGRDGDRGCVFGLGNGETNSICQVLRNLKPGRTYSVRYVVAPVKAYREKADGAWSADIIASVRGAEVVTDEMPVHRYGCVERHGKYCVQRTLVFRANAHEAELVFSCAPQAKVGENLFLSSVRVRPYFSGVR